MEILCTDACDVVDCVVSVVVVVVVIGTDGSIGVDDVNVGADGLPFLCRARSTRLANVTEELSENGS